MIWLTIKYDSLSICFAIQVIFIILVLKIYLEFNTTEGITELDLLYFTQENELFGESFFLFN